MKTDTKKSLWAVVAGTLFIIVVTTLADIVLHLVHVYAAWDQPLDPKLAVLATAYRIVISVAGAYLTASLAPKLPMKHALILGCVGIPLGTLGIIANMFKPMGPMWYPIALVVLAVPQCWLGGQIYEMRHPAR
jgi:hypothetical protein